MISLHSLILHEDKGSVLHINILNSEDHDYVDTSTWINKLKNQPQISKNIFFAYSFLLLQFTICLIVSSLSRYLVLNNISFFILFISEL